ncbi:uncharacterized protein N7498_007283 [Penicillium cinerascens]|uniref:Uncharacterized protein n=1 Tax=Penicillium cinerascens TaxID=70096 RepID=A0A9W9JPW6_9EURO|nr:uncharacterized protein N7498_007283 [Penicillium cinerascens]KAJ5198166.1 hypothetical protein N7498_007283 [Penicillium cinerascens]
MTIHEPPHRPDKGKGSKRWGCQYLRIVRLDSNRHDPQMMSNMEKTSTDLLLPDLLEDQGAYRLRMPWIQFHDLLTQSRNC